MYFFFQRERKSTKKNTALSDQRISSLLASNVLPLTLRVSRFTLIPAKAKRHQDISVAPRGGGTSHSTNSSEYYKPKYIRAAGSACHGLMLFPFAGFRRIFGVKRQITCGEQMMYRFGLMKCYKAIDLQGRALLLVSFLARARKVRPFCQKPWTKKSFLP